MKAPEYLAINPMGKVPALRHGATAVTECAAICCYLADAFPDAGLAPPPGDRLRGPYYRWMFFAAGPVEAAVTAKHHGFDSGGDPRKEMSVGWGSYDRVVAMLEGWFAGRDYVCGPRFTMADVYVGSQIDWGQQFGTIPARPSLAAYAERVRAREAYQAGKAIDNALIAEMQAANPA